MEFKENTMIIEYPHRWGGQFEDKRCWMSRKQGTSEVDDWHSVSHLIKNAEEDGFEWVVLRNHKDGTKSIIKKSKECEIISQ